MAIIDEGKEEHAKALILRLGQKKFGPADGAIKAKLAAIADVERLDRQIDRISDAASWQDLLDTP
jgi:hypothetical protein